MRILHIFLQFSLIASLCFIMQTESFFMPAAGAAGGAGMGSAAASAIGMGGIAASVMGPFQLLLLTKLSLGLGTAASFLSQALIENFKLRKESDEREVSKFPLFGRKGSDESHEFPLLNLFHKKTGSYESNERSSEEEYKKTQKYEKTSNARPEEKKSLRKRRHYSSEETEFPFFPYLKFLYKSHLSKFYSDEDSDEYSYEGSYKKDHKGEYSDQGYDKGSSSYEDHKESKDSSDRSKSLPKVYPESYHKDRSDEVSVFGLLEKKLHLARTLIAGSGEHQTVYLVKKKYDEYDGDSVYEAHIDGSKVKFVKPKGYDGGYSYEGKTLSPQSEEDYHGSSSDSQGKEDYHGGNEGDDGKYPESSDKYGHSADDHKEYERDQIHGDSHGGSHHSSSSREYKKYNGNNYKLVYYADKSSEESKSYERKYHDLTKAIHDAVKSHYDYPKPNYSEGRSGPEKNLDTHDERGVEHQVEEHDAVHEKESESHKVEEYDELNEKNEEDSYKEEEPTVDDGPVARSIDSQLMHRNTVNQRERFRFPTRQSRSRSNRRSSDESQRFVDYPDYDSFQGRADYDYNDRSSRFDNFGIVGVPLPPVRGVGGFPNRGRMLSRLDNFDYDSDRADRSQRFGVRLPGRRPSSIRTDEDFVGVGGVPLPRSENTFETVNGKSGRNIGVNIPRLGKELDHRNDGSNVEVGVSLPRVEIGSDFREEDSIRDVGVGLPRGKISPDFRDGESVGQVGVRLPLVETDLDHGDNENIEETKIRRPHIETESRTLDKNSFRGIDVPINFHISVGGYDPHTKSNDDIENENLDPVDAAKKLKFRLEDIEPKKRGLWTEYSAERKQVSFFLSGENQEDKVSSKPRAFSRDIGDHQETKDSFFSFKEQPHHLNEEYIYEKIKKSDPSDCNEKLLCDLGTKSTTNPTDLKKDEMAILTQVAFSPSDDEISEAHSVYEIALAKGFSGSDCKRLYPKCMFSGEQLMRFIRILDKRMGEKTVEEIEDLLLK